MALQEFADWITYSVLGLAKESQFGAAANFFVYDSIKVVLLLAAITFVVGVIRTFVTRQRVRRLLGGRREGAGNVLAALLGVPTPFCSCSAVPIFMGLVESGVPLGITFSFLISAPLINEVAVVMLFAMFDWQIAALYIGTGLVVAVIAGVVIGRLKLEKEVEGFVYRTKLKKAKEGRMDWNDRLSFGLAQSKAITPKVLPYILLGIAIGGLIHGYAPSDFLAGIADRGNPLAVPIAVLIGVPLYSNAAGMVPIVSVLVSKGVPIGTALAFMMSVIGLSFPEMVILRKVLKPKLLAVFAAVLFVSFVAVGYLFNIVLG